ncbi:MAG: hypothetical protein GIX03_13055 [Candidatus Eremiobacteraeota bacterium]|nr:hypothetical protein [Candidatus Eremiobacteraeota bacterium]MBC5803894.1 hypothetical protein [Candidatus Eremiobacteraeota bacterium]MBC5825150.1 hypothetical protein [Candidatus Eremiobacteraeota bacterium]
MTTYECPLCGVPIAYGEAHDCPRRKFVRFTCPAVPDLHKEFYAVHHESVSHEVSAAGIVGDEIKNTYEGEGYDDVHCRKCNAVALDSTPDEELLDD